MHTGKDGYLPRVHRGRRSIDWLSGDRTSPATHSPRNEKGLPMDNVLQFILDLFNNETAAQQFVTNPDLALATAGLSDVSPEVLQSVASSAVPGLLLAGGHP